MKNLFVMTVALLGANLAFAKFEKSAPLTVSNRQPAAASGSAAHTSKVNSQQALPAGRIATQTVAFNQKSLGPKGYLKADQVGGCCLPVSTRVRVETLEGKTISDEVIETFETFTLSGLKPANTYNLILIHPRYRTALKLEKVHAGNWINFRSP